MFKRFLSIVLIVSGCLQAHSFEKRYAIIKKYLDQYSRAFTAIEVNPEPKNALSLAISRDYQCTCVMFGSFDYSGVVQECKREQDHNLIIAQQEEISKYCNRLWQCEHFDIVLIPEVRFKRSSLDPNIFELYTQLGDHTIIELLMPRDEEPLQNLMLAGKQLTLLATTKYSSALNSNFYVSYNPRTSLRRRRWTAKISDRRFYDITATFSEKTFKKRESKAKLLPWAPGINLLSFAKLKGMYPEKEHLANKLREFSTVVHGDLAIGNIIIQGRSLKLIDWDRNKINAPAAERVERIIAKLFKNLGSKRNYFD